MSSENTVTQIIGVGYLGTIQGVCKIVEIIFSFIAVLLVGIDFRGWVVELFEVATSVCIIIAAILLILYVSGVVAKIIILWNKAQFVSLTALAIFYLIAAALVLHHGSGSSKLIAGGVFGLFAVFALVIDAFDNYRKDPLL